jgi:hypothetical protein
MAKVRMVEETKLENKIYAPPVVKTQSPAEIARLLKEDSPPKVEPTVEPPLVQPAPLTGRYLVLEAKIVSFNGHITFLPKDTLVDDSSYGPGAIEKLLAAGVKLEKQA